MSRITPEQHTADSDKQRIRDLEGTIERNIGRIKAALGGFSMQQSANDPNSYHGVIDRQGLSGVKAEGSAYSYAGVGSHYELTLQLGEDQSVQFEGAYDPNPGPAAKYVVTEQGKEVIGAKFDDATRVIEGQGELEGAPEADVLERFAYDTALLAGELSSPEQ